MNEAQQLRLLTDALPQIVCIAQADGGHTWFNQRWFDYSGLCMEDSLGHGWRSAIHPDDSLRASRAWEQACTRCELFETEYRLRRTDGMYRWMLGRALPQRDAAGQVTQWLGTLTDIDELKQTAEHLEKDFAMTSIASRVAHLGGWTIELPERVLTWSDENCLIHDLPPGYRPTLEEGISYFFSEDRPAVQRLVDACAQHGTPYEFVLPKRTAKGRRIWVRSVGEAVRDAEGKIIRLQGAFQDITEQKEAEAHTLALEAQLRTTLESITDGFCLVDREWRLTFVNGPAERMLRRRREDVLGKNIWEEFPETLGSPMEREYRTAVQEKRTTHFETFYPPLDLWFEIRAYPTEAGLAVYFQDITQRRAEQAQLHLLEKAVSRLNDMVVITEVAPVDESGPRIVFVNDAFERQTGYSREEVIGSTPGMFWGPHTQQVELDRIRAAMEKWQTVRTELVMYTKAGKELWLEIDIAPIAGESGRFTHWVGVERDITERKQQQQEILSLNGELEKRVLLRTTQLATANKELESFAYSVSHDLRSPLNTIHGFSKLLAKIDAENISDKGKHYLARIGAGVEQMGELIEGLLTLAHMSREQLKSEPVDLSALARLIERDHREREPQRQVQVLIQDGMGAHGDPRLLLAVLQNLLANAWKFTAKKPQACIEMGNGLGSDGVPFFFVRDNGAGFDMAFTHKLFGTFERLHSPGDFAGTGIGLATVKRIIERHGGRVWAESKVNEGATFYFTLSRQAEWAI
ncbi:PAS domain-containing sensor histidine kinase [Polaromonas sp.]|uniref:PAS domain-containing sensor histidine kinase n=1 Tax=Polaromonas sp. TaxID=1869339 RepID=UPI003C99F33B